MIRIQTQLLTWFIVIIFFVTATAIPARAQEGLTTIENPGDGQIINL